MAKDRNAKPLATMHRLICFEGESTRRPNPTAVHRYTSKSNALSSIKTWPYPLVAVWTRSRDCVYPLTGIGERLRSRPRGFENRLNSGAGHCRWTICSSEHFQQVVQHSSQLIVGPRGQEINIVKSTPAYNSTTRVSSPLCLRTAPS